MVPPYEDHGDRNAGRQFHAERHHDLYLYSGSLAFDIHSGYRNRPLAQDPHNDLRQWHQRSYIRMELHISHGNCIQRPLGVSDSFAWLQATCRRGRDRDRRQQYCDDHAIGSVGSLLTA